MSTIEQHSLFTQLITDPVLGPVRRRDPQTSHDAATSMPHRIRWGTHRFDLLKAFAGRRAVALDGLTDEQAGELCGLSHVAATRRLSELRSAGLIEATTRLGTTVAGLSCMVCVLTDAGREALDAAWAAAK